MTKLTVFAVITGLLTLLLIIEFVRRRKLPESFALLWVAVALGAGVIGVFRTVFDDIAHRIGVDYGAAFMFLLAILFLLFVSMILSVHISRLTERTEVLAQEVTFLRGLLGADPGAPGPIVPRPAGDDPRSVATGD